MHRISVKTKRQIHARECRLKADSNQRSKAKEVLRMMYTHAQKQR